MDKASSPEVVLFAAAMGMPAEARAAFLQSRCPHDPELRARVEALLLSNKAVGDFLESSPVTAALGNTAALFSAAKDGDRIGRYKLVRELGEGGCGVVFLAEQEEPVRRLVALKLIKPGMDTKSVISRFEAEQQALALMDHPNIAKVFDAGTTEFGRPFFVMELVRGSKITDFCDEHCLSIIDRLHLFINVCQAVQHAHQKGVIHRDIKPSNILVTRADDGQPLPRIIDFGIAKATTRQGLSDKTVLTAFEMLIGTPAYMSPEQADFTSVEVDTRTDIYSLGVLLYELLAGVPPFDSHELMKVGLDEVRRAIREKEPIRPSTAVTMLDEDKLQSIAKTRQLHPSKMARAFRGDLDWIVMKALEKDKARRYQSANSFGEDIKHYVANEVVSAGPPSASHKARKLIFRNKLLFSGLSIIFLVLVAALTTTSWLLLREKKARREADLSRLETLGRAFREQGKLIDAENMYRQAVAIRRDLIENEPRPMTESLSYLIDMLMRQNKFGEAEDILNELLPPAAIGRLQQISPLVVRTEFFARRGRWIEAARDIGHVVARDPEEHSYYHMLAPLLVAADDRKAYYALCPRIVERFKNTTDAYVADRMAKDCLILPVPNLDLRAVAQMTETAVTRGSGTYDLPNFQYCKALAQYRQGHFTEALEWAERAVKYPLPYPEAGSYAILAMAKHQLNQKDAAEVALAKCVQLIQTKLPKLADGDLDGGWRDWIVLQALLVEATALVKNEMPHQEASGKK
jgi:serine/threonine protein kinase